MAIVLSQTAPPLSMAFTWNYVSQPEFVLGESLSTLIISKLLTVNLSPLTDQPTTNTWVLPKMVLLN